MDSSAQEDQSVDVPGVVETRFSKMREVLDPATDLLDEIRAKLDLSMPVEEVKPPKENAEEFVKRTLRKSKKDVIEAEFLGFDPRGPQSLPGNIAPLTSFTNICNAYPSSKISAGVAQRMSETSRAVSDILKDFFWIFYQRVGANVVRDPNNEEKMLDRISANFVSLLFSVDLASRDRFFRTLHDRFAETVVALFMKTFPDSQPLFGEAFSEQVGRDIKMWMTGTSAVYPFWHDWKGTFVNRRGTRTRTVGRTLVGGTGGRTTTKKGEGTRRGVVPRLNLGAVKNKQKIGVKSFAAGSLSARNRSMNRENFNVYNRSPLVERFMAKKKLQPEKHAAQKMRLTTDRECLTERNNRGAVRMSTERVKNAIQAYNALKNETQRQLGSIRTTQRKEVSRLEAERQRTTDGQQATHMLSDRISGYRKDPLSEVKKTRDLVAQQSTTDQKITTRTPQEEVRRIRLAIEREQSLAHARGYPLAIAHVKK